MFSLAPIARQIDFKGRSLIRFAVYIDETTVLLYNSIDSGKPQPGTFSHFLGSKKRLEEVIQSFLVHPATVVTDSEASHIHRGCIPDDQHSMRHQR